MYANNISAFNYTSSNITSERSLLARNQANKNYAKKEQLSTSTKAYSYFAQSGEIIYVQTTINVT